MICKKKFRTSLYAGWHCGLGRRSKRRLNWWMLRNASIAIFCISIQCQTLFLLHSYGKVATFSFKSQNLRKSWRNGYPLSYSIYQELLLHIRQNFFQLSILHKDTLKNSNLPKIFSQKNNSQKKHQYFQAWQVQCFRFIKRFDARRIVMIGLVFCKIVWFVFHYQCVITITVLKIVQHSVTEHTEEDGVV